MKTINHNIPRGPNGEKDLNDWDRNGIWGDLAAQKIDTETASDDSEENPYPLIWLRDATPKINTPSLLRGVIPAEAMIVTYGESGSGKTFHVLDRDLCIAAGRSWYGREATPGFVLYIAAEGPHSVINRISAYRQEWMPETDAPFAVLPKAINLLNPDADTDQIIDFIKRIEQQIGQKCVKVTADTLARVMSGGNENSPDDMGAVVANADAIRHSCACTFEFVHHAGKNVSLGARGHSSLRAATDTEIEVSAKDDLHVAKVTKQRDGPEGDEFAYTLRMVELGTDTHGHPVTTCVPDWELDAKRSDRPSITKQEHEVMRLMGEVMDKGKRLPPNTCWDAKHPPKPGQIACPVEDLRTLAGRTGGLSDSDNPDTQQRALRRALKSLQTKAVIGLMDDWAWWADINGQGGHS